METELKRPPNFPDGRLCTSLRGKKRDDSEHIVLLELFRAEQYNYHNEYFPRAEK